MNKRKKKQLTVKQIILRISAGVLIIIALIVTIISLTKMKKSKNEFEECKIISSKEDLEKALTGKSQNYVLIDVPVSGEKLKDKYNALIDDYIYIRYIGYRCRVDDSKDSTLHTRYTWDATGKEDEYIAKKLYLYDDLEVIRDTDIKIQNLKSLELNSDTIAKEELDRCKNDYFYPDKVEEREDNTKYEIQALHNKTEVSFTANIGDGRLTCVDGRGCINIVPNGRYKDVIRYDVNADYYDTIYITWFICGFISIIIFALSLRD